jgi:hypothetical protein
MHSVLPCMDHAIARCVMYKILQDSTSHGTLLQLCARQGQLLLRRHRNEAGMQGCAHARNVSSMRVNVLFRVVQRVLVHRPKHTQCASPQLPWGLNALGYDMPQLAQEMQALCRHPLNVRLLLQDGPLLVTVAGLSSSGFLLAVDSIGQQYELTPDGNSLDMMQGMIRRKLPS